MTRHMGLGLLLALAARTLTAAPVIQGAVINAVSNTIAITGTGLSTTSGSPEVKLDGIALTLANWSSTSIVANLPSGLAAGTYELTVRAGATTSFEVAIGAIGPQGPAGPAGPQGQPGATGPQGPAGAQGPMGPAGPVGPQGLNWKGAWSTSVTYSQNDAVSFNGSAYISLVAANAANEPDTSPAAWSQVAAPGAAGAPGPPGVNGQNGQPGPAGPMGATGAQGPQGPTGPAGPAGPQGLNWKGLWNPSSAYNQNDAVSFNGSAYISLMVGNAANEPDTSPAAWSQLAAAGAAGAQGPAGTSGPQGPAGAPGAQGSAGPMGATGAQGPQGPSGPTGPAGPAGPAGPPLTLPYSGTVAASNAAAFTIINTAGSGIAASGASGYGGVFGGGQSGDSGLAGVQAVGGGAGITAGGPAFAGLGAAGGYNGGDGIDVTGGDSPSYGGTGVFGTGGTGSGTQGGNGVLGQGGSGFSGGAGGIFIGGFNTNDSSTTPGGDGVQAIGGSSTSAGIYAQAHIFSPLSMAGLFNGDVQVFGNLSKSGGSFQIDHPLDPANKYLYHSFVESPDMTNIYHGNVITDGGGRAIVTLPDWFEPLNRDFRYQLTVIGQFAHAIVASEINGNSFAIRTDKPNVKVSWLVIGIRQDAWANAHRIPVEADKAEADKGHYLHPELFGHEGEPNIPELHHPGPPKRQQK